MANIVGPRSRRNDKQTRQPVVISAAIAVLAATVLVCAGLLVVQLWTALVQGSRFQHIADRCKMLKDAHARETCDERLKCECLQDQAEAARTRSIRSSPRRP